MFKTIRKVSDLYLGLSVSEKCEKLQRLNIRSLSCMFFMFQFFFSSLIFFLAEAKTPDEIANSFYIYMTMITMLTATIIFIVKSKKIFCMIGNFEIFTEERENKI